MREFFTEHWGDLASTIGLIVAFIGFWYTVRVAKDARKAAEEARDRIIALDCLTDLAEALSILEEIRRLHRAKAWHILLERYSIAKARLVKSAHLLKLHSDSSDSEKRAGIIGGIIVHLGSFEANVEPMVHSDEQKIDTLKANKILSLQIDRLREIYNSYRIEIGNKG